MIKKIFNLSLMAALLCGLSLSVTSCKDDDDSNAGGDNNSQQDADTEVVDATDTPEKHLAWTWISSLADVDNATENWESQTFEPIIGEESQNEAQARLLYVNDLEEARASFSAIAGCNPNDLKGEKTISAGDYGTMEWAPSPANASNLATVQVDCRLMPKLSKLIYCTAAQAPDNAAFTGTAYYRLGDVVEDAEGYYWVCVRPSFSVGNLKDSYWVNIFNAAETGRGVKTGKLPGIPEKNIYSKYNKKYNDNIILLPTALASNREHVFLLNNLVQALLYPENYAEKVGVAGKGLCGIPYTYHGRYFLDQVNRYWMDGEIWEKLFNCAFGLLKETPRFDYFYNGYHWKVGSTAGVWLYESTNGYHTKYEGSMDDDDTLYEMKAKGAGFDIRRYASDPLQDPECCKSTNTARKGNWAPSDQFDKTDRRWVVRYRSGKQLDTQKKYDPFKAITGVHEIYRYNAKTQKLEGTDLVTEDDLNSDGNLESRYMGKSHYHIGDVYKDQNGHRWFVISASGISGTNTNLYGDVTIFDNESSPWTELVSFDGLQVSDNKQVIKNLPTLKQAIRSTMFLQWMWMFASPSVRNNKGFSSTSPNAILRVMANIYEQTDVDTRYLFQSITAQNNDPRQPSQVVSVMYRDESVPADQAMSQNLVRIVVNCQNERKDNQFYCWTCYPKNPSTAKTAVKLNADAFTTNLIKLQDLQDEDFVKAHADDSYAVMPLHSDLHGGNQQARSVRTTAEPKAGNVTNYLYNKDTWQSFSYPTDMWNAPCMAFRYTRVHDRGDNDFEFVTEDGLQLSPLKLVTYEVDEDGDEYESVKTSNHIVYTTFDLVKVNGNIFKPHWDPFTGR